MISSSEIHSLNDSIPIEVRPSEKETVCNSELDIKDWLETSSKSSPRKSVLSDDDWNDNG